MCIHLKTQEHQQQKQLQKNDNLKDKYKLYIKKIHSTVFGNRFSLQTETITCFNEAGSRWSAYYLSDIPNI